MSLPHPALFNNSEFKAFQHFNKCCSIQLACFFVLVGIRGVLIKPGGQQDHLCESGPPRWYH